MGGALNSQTGVAFPNQLFRSSDFSGIISNRMILRHRPHPPHGLPAVLLPALAGGMALVCPPAASAQAIGTMQVTALVVPAPAAWPTLAATAQLAALAEASIGPSRLEAGLAQLEREPDGPETRRVLIRVDYLRN